MPLQDPCSFHHTIKALFLILLGPLSHSCMCQHAVLASHVMMLCNRVHELIWGSGCLISCLTNACLNIYDEDSSHRAL